MKGVYQSIAKRSGSVWKSKQGSILLYTLALFIGFIGFYHALIIQEIQSHKRQVWIETITKRLDTQAAVLKMYQSECDFSFWKEEEAIQEYLCHYTIDDENGQYLIDASELEIYVFNEYGVSLMKYDIMEDGSVIETILEETI